MKFFAKKHSSFRVASKTWNRCLWRRGTEGSPALLGASDHPVLTQRFKIQVSQLGLTGTIFSPCLGEQLGTGSMAQRGDIQLVPPAVARPWWDEGLVRLGGVFMCWLWEWFREVLWDAGGWEIHAWGCSSGNVCEDDGHLLFFITLHHTGMPKWKPSFLLPRRCPHTLISRQGNYSG